MKPIFIINLNIFFRSKPNKPNNCENKKKKLVN